MRAPSSVNGNYILFVLSPKSGTIALIDKIQTNLPQQSNIETEMQHLWPVDRS